MNPAVALLGITQRFAAVTALDAVDLEVTPGTLHAIVGENGAGKTTLMRVLYGALQPTEGTIALDGGPIRLESSARAIARGIGMVSQHYGIIPALTCLENLVLGAEGGPILHPKAAAERAQTLADEMGFQFDWHAPAETLSPAGNQKLEILKLLWRRARVMILDEPTAMLSPHDADALFESLRKLVAGGATVLLVTHRLPEVMNHCSRVTVLRGGRRVADLAVADTSATELARLIVGDGVALADSLPPASVSLGEPRLTVKGLSARDDRGFLALREVALTVRAGEVVGIAGVDGNGQRELFRAIAGVVPAAAGSIALDEADATEDSAAARITRGLRVIPEDRHEEAVIEAWSLVENGILGLQRLSPIAQGARIDSAAQRSWAQAVAARFATKFGRLDDPIASLSGGNQQRFVAARALERDPRLLLAFQPARGLDLKGTADVYGAIRARCADGMGALIVSFDLDELLAHCDRVVVLNHGELFEPPVDEARNRDTIGRLMVGAA